MDNLATSFILSGIVLLGAMIIRFQAELKAELKEIRRLLEEVLASSRKEDNNR